jgi:hypothetical protein
MVSRPRPICSSICARFPHLVGFKEFGGAEPLSYAAQHIAGADDSVMMMVGVDTQVFHGFVNCGAVGAITGIGNVLPKEVLHLVSLCRKAAQGDVRARRQAMELEQALGVLSSFDEGADLLAASAAALKACASQTMLTPGIHKSYEAGIQFLLEHSSVETIARGEVGQGLTQGRGALFATDAQTFLADERLGYEVFGSSSLVVRCPDVDTLILISERLEGQLTATLQMEPSDAPIARSLIPILERKVGRILANGWPTGVEVGHAMVHGGPFPATSDSRTTSVGSLAIQRFLRPVCYQDLPPHLLPEELRDAGARRLPLLLNGIRHSPRPRDP